MKIKHSYQPLTYVTYSIVGITVLTGILLSCNIPIFPGIGIIYTTSALDQTKTANAAIRVRSTCSMTATIDSGNEHTATMINGQYKENIGLTTITTFCNDPNGYAIYAIGYTGGDTGVAAGTNTVLHSNALGSTYDIVTGIATSGDISNWAMKVSSVSGAYEPNILNGYNNYSVIPQSYTKVANYSSSTDLATIGSSLTTTYAAYIKPTQPSGTYEGRVKYVLVHPAEHTVPGVYYMQDVEDWGQTISVGQEVTAYDNRDNKSYTVRRMCMKGSGNTWQDKETMCGDSMLWMTQNLDLDLDVNTELNSVNTDLNTMNITDAYVSGYRIDENGVIYWKPVSSTVANVNTTNGKIDGWANSVTVPSSADPDGKILDSFWHTTGDLYNSNSCGANGDQTCNYLNSSNTIAPTYFSKTPFITNGNHGKIGNYYNWSAAIASNNSSSFHESGHDKPLNNPKNSICPSGWRLPVTSTVISDNEFASLNNIYNDGLYNSGYGLIARPIYMIRSGAISLGGALKNAGSYGFYWSSTVSNANNAFYQYFTSDVVNVMSAANGRNLGISIRCVSDY